MSSKNGKTTVNTFSGGIQLDIDKSLLKENQYRYAENVRIVSNEGATTGALTNIEGSTILSLGSDTFSVDEDIIATTTIRDLGVVITALPSKRTGMLTYDWNEQPDTGTITIPAKAEETIVIEDSRTTPDPVSPNANLLYVEWTGIGTKELRCQFQDLLTTTVSFKVTVTYTDSSNEVFNVFLDQSATPRSVNPASPYVITTVLRMDLKSPYMQYISVNSFLPTHDGAMCDNNGVEGYYPVETRRYKNVTQYYLYETDYYSPDPVTYRGVDIVTSHNVVHDEQFYEVATIIGIYNSYVSGRVNLAISTPLTLNLNAYLYDVDINTISGRYNGANTLHFNSATIYSFDGEYISSVQSRSVEIQDIIKNSDGIHSDIIAANHQIPIYTQQDISIDCIDKNYNNVSAIATYLTDGRLSTNLVYNKSAITSNKIYRVSFPDDKSPVFKNVLNPNGVNFNTPLNPNLSMVGRYEDFDNIKLYWADGVNFIRCVNIASTNDLNNSVLTDSSIFDLIPSSKLVSPSIVSIGSGRLDAGLIQYCYQLYSPSGGETELSPMSPVVHLTNSEVLDYSVKYMGTGIGDIHGKSTGKSVKVGIKIPDNNKFIRAKLISVYYFNYSDVPVISVVKELDIKSEQDNGYIYLEDGGVGAVGELTQSEFNLIGGNLFIPNYIESKDNILFAANTKEDTWDLSTEEYDTRSYQFKDEFTGVTIPANPKLVTLRTVVMKGSATIEVNIVDDYTTVSSAVSIGDILKEINGVPIAREIKVISISDDKNWIGFDSSEIGLTYVNGCSIVISEPYTVEIQKKAKLSMASGESSSYSLSQLQSILPTHDCIHDEIYKEDRYADLQYRYDKDGNLGGSGLNVDYKFTNAFFIESYGDYYGKRVNSTSGDTYSESWVTDADKYIDQRTARIGDKKRNISSIKLQDSDGTIYDAPLSNFGLPVHDGFLNYANPYLSNNFTSYQRDEIYRFGAIFRDTKGRKTPVKWIADIRFPAGYVENSKWAPNIFEVPEETYNLPYVGTELEFQELIVKPLGLKFNFRNLPKSVVSVEIVRAKRDINNKTIYAQGIIQKTGTQYPSYQQDHLNDTGYIIDEGITNTLRPHPIVSMGYATSICGIVRNQNGNIPHSINIENEGSFWYDFNDYTGNTFSQDNSQVRTTARYTDHALSPYFYYKNSVLFVNPETSYYGVDFTEQLRNIADSIKMDIVDIAYPISTPPLTAMAPNVKGRYYIGGLEQDRLQFKVVGDSANRWYPTAMYFAADLNKKIRSSFPIPSTTAPIFTIGLVGADYRRIASETTGYTSYNHMWNAINASPVSDITIQSSWNALEKGDRAYISLGGLLAYAGDNKYIYKNGYVYDVASATTDDPFILVDAASTNGASGATFKYFNRYVSRSSTIQNNISLVFQKTSNLEDATVYTFAGLDVPKTNPYSSSTVESFSLIRKVSSFEYSGSINPGLPIEKVSGSDYVTAGSIQYLNWSKPLTGGNEGQTNSTDIKNIISVLTKTKVGGPHGAGIILSLEDMEQFPTISDVNQSKKIYDGVNGLYSGYKTLDRIGSSSLSTYITNMKMMNSYIYGGSSLLDRQFTEYISTGCSFDNIDGNGTSVVFGGDTFIGIFDYTAVKATDPYVAYDSSTKIGRGANIASQVRHIGALIPLESSINLHLVNSKSYIADGNNFAIQDEPGVYSPGASIGSKWKHTQLLPQYKYNSAYSSEMTAIGSLSKLLITQSNKTFDCRVWSSEPKTNDELYDNWSKFKVANYIDVDTKYGEITGLKAFRDKLLFWQRDSFGVLSVNERSLIKDNNISLLTLGTGGILSRFDYISTSNGMKKGMIGGVTESESNLYWFDLNNLELCTFGGSLSVLSKAKGIQTILNMNRENITDKIPMVFDKKYNEVMITLDGLQGVDNIR